MSRFPLLGFAAAGLLMLLVLCSAQAADESIDVLTIADSTGDWGFPSLFGHYSRGPDYICMRLIFDG
jgi:peptide/nickel transport system substrate-binding protein